MSRDITDLTDEQKKKRLAQLRSLLKSSRNLGPPIGSKSETGSGSGKTYTRKTHGFSPEQEQYLKLLDWEKKGKK